VGVAGVLSMSNSRRRAAAQFDEALRHHRAGRLLEAERLYRQVCAADPTHAGGFHLLGVVAHQLGRPDAADSIRRALALKPEAAAIHNDLGAVLAAQGKFADAAASFARAAALAPDFAEAHNNLGAALSNDGRFAEAGAAFERALAIKPDFAPAHVALGNALRAQGQREQAAAAYRKALACAPGFAMAHFNLGLTLRALGQGDAALPHLERAVALAPNIADARNALAAALQESGKAEEALRHYRTAVALQPDFAGAHNNLANALRELGRLDEATGHYERALALEPGFAAARYNLGVALRGQGRLAEAAAHFAHAVTSAPDFLAAHFALCMAKLPILYETEEEIEQRRGEYQECLTALEAAVDASPAPGSLADAVGAHQPFYLAYQCRNDRELQARYGSLVCRIMAARYAAAIPPARPAPNEPVRVAIVSGFFRRHSNWKIPIKGWLSRLDRRRFRLFGYYTAADPDSETELAAIFCERFVQGPLSLDGWRQAIRADAPHVILYPEVGMDPVSAQLAAQRLAPVQCGSWGHPETSGFPTLDYYLSSDLMEPSDGAQHYTEQLVRLPGLSIYYEPPDAPAGPADRAALGLRAGATVFWCSQSLPKYLPQFDQVFPRIARGVPDCQFTFISFPGSAEVTKRFQTRLEGAFASFDLRAEDHCVFLPRLDPQAFAAAIGACDVVLDSIGWSGCNSILESLAHDLPIVTVTAELMRGRHATAILNMIDVPETITESPDAYVATAIRLAREAAWRTELKAKIARNKHRLYRDETCITALETFLETQARAPSGA
jgi:predicted O-linked N-acetylglucosamine transferase (SPINDLY family)